MRNPTIWKGAAGFPLGAAGLYLKYEYTLVLQSFTDCRKWFRKIVQPAYTANLLRICSRTVSTHLTRSITQAQLEPRMNLLSNNTDIRLICIDEPMRHGATAPEQHSCCWGRATAALPNLDQRLFLMSGRQHGACSNTHSSNIRPPQGPAQKGSRRSRCLYWPH